MLLAHLSDLHLCKENGGRQQRKVVVDLLRSAKHQGCQHFLISGDIVQYANHRDLQAFLTDVQKIGIGPTELSLLPGNHDVFPVSSKNIWRSLFLFSKRESYYQRFFTIGRDYFGEILCRKPLVYCRKLDDHHVVFAVDSNDYRVRSHRNSGRGYIGPESWDVVDKAIAKYGYSGYRKILMIHHYPFEWTNSSKGGRAREHDLDFINLPKVQSEITERDWQFVVCGHSHRTSGVTKLGHIPVVNSASSPAKGHYICSILDTNAEIIPKRLETNLNPRLRMIFSKYRKE